MNDHTHTFGKYKLVAELGQGGMADVILALSQGPVGFNKLVVIKRLRAHLADEPEFRGMLMDEARLAARLNHPNIVHTNEVGDANGRFFMAMEYLEGQPLSRIKRRARRREHEEFGVNAMLRILMDVLDGLHYAHELTDFDGTPLNVVHRDVTPSNVFVTYDGMVKVVDFGIAKAGGRTTETKTGVVKGKMTYMPPEQALGVQIDRRADIYSVGVMFWEAVVGKRMWKGLDDVVVLGKLIHGEIPTSPKEANPDVPEELDRICRKALDPEPDNRYATAAEFQMDIETYLKSAGHVPTNRDIGRIVSELYAEERAELKRIIETQLAKIKATESGASSLEPVIMNDLVPPSHTPASLSRTDIVPGGREKDDSIPEKGEAGSSATPAEGGATSEIRPSVHAVSKRRAWLGIAAVVVGVAAAILWFAGERSSGSPSAAQVTESLPVIAPTVSEVSSQSSAEADEPVMVRVTLRASPNDAFFRIDGGEPLDNPYVGEFPKDEDEHELEIEAEGYESKTKRVRFDKDVFLDVSLDKEDRRVVRRRRPPPKPEPEPVAPPPTQHVPKPKPKPDLWEGDPWKD